MSWRLALAVCCLLLAAVAVARLSENPESGTATWDASRASGFIGYLLLWASTITGMGVHLRVRPLSGVLGRTLELHRILSALGMAFVVVHVFALLLDPVVHFAPQDGVLGFTSGYRPLPVAAGAVAQWTLVVVLASTARSRAIPWNLWRRLHLLSFPCYLLALVHGVTAGSDSGHALALSIYIMTAGLLAAALVVRSAGRGWVEAGELRPLSR